MNTINPNDVDLDEVITTTYDEIGTLLRQVSHEVALEASGYVFTHINRVIQSQRLVAMDSAYTDEERATARATRKLLEDIFNAATLDRNNWMHKQAERTWAGHIDELGRTEPVPVGGYACVFCNQTNGCICEAITDGAEDA